jgi:L-alanine-DL-glutamate epimerase-like enolase superfamily enzyme
MKVSEGTRTPDRLDHNSSSPAWCRIWTCSGSRSRTAGTTIVETCATYGPIGGTRVCAGQSELSAGGWRDLFEAGAIDVCNFDASWSGGPTEWRGVAALAAVYGVEMAHHEEPHVSAHLLASIPHGTYVECFHPDRDPIWWNLVANRPELVDGQLHLSERPGLGWELDADYIDMHRVPVA